MKKLLRKMSRVVANLKHLDSTATVHVALKKQILAYWSNSAETQRNFGDAINPLILGGLTGVDVAHATQVINFCNRPKLFFIGSILDNLCDLNAIVFGAGFKAETSRIYLKPKRVLAVRGPLTRNLFLKNGVPCPEVFCDPALLLPDFIQPTNSKKEWDVGIIPHYADKKAFDAVKIETSGLSFKVIDIENSFTDIVREMNNCSFIFSSSLHGIIVAHAYGIPAVWLKLTENVSGNGFKFMDYYYSGGCTDVRCYHVDKVLDLGLGVSLCSYLDMSENVRSLKQQLPLLKDLLKLKVSDA